jgi:hypothetical protein
VPTLFASCAEAQQTKGAAPLTKGAWMSQAIATIKGSDSPLYFGRFRDEWYFLTAPIEWKRNPGQSGPEGVEVPRGFVSDLASIPPIFFSVLRPDGQYAYASIIHDYLYWEQSQPRAIADEIFKMSMQDFQIDQSKIFAIYEAVRTLGQRAWDANKQLKQKGEKRVLKTFPPNARVLWTDWKKQTDVFAP